MSIDELLQTDYDELLDLAEQGRGESGSYGSRAQKISSGLNVNGFLTTEFKHVKNVPNSFDNHYFVLFFNKELNSNLSVDAQIEYEHGGEYLELQFAHVDYKINNLLTFRVGKFIVPSSPFNEYNYPDYLAKTIERDYINREISPTVWGETGIQVRGFWDLKRKFRLYYSVYMVNGLEADSSNVSIRDMRGNNLDQLSSNKAIGGRVGAVVNKHTEVGFWSYSGHYDSAKKLNLTLMGTDITFRYKSIYLSGDLQFGKKERLSDTQNYSGFSTIAAYRINKFEPVIRFEQFDNQIESLKNRFTIGCNYFLSDYTVAKVNYDFISLKDNNSSDSQISVQLTIGF